MTFFTRQSHLSTHNENMPEINLAFLNNLKWKKKSYFKVNMMFHLKKNQINFLKSNKSFSNLNILCRDFNVIDNFTFLVTMSVVVWKMHYLSFSKFWSRFCFNSGFEALFIFI